MAGYFTQISFAEFFMIVTSAVANWVVKFADRFNPIDTVGVTIWPFIFIWPAKHTENKRLVRHEKKHLEQWKRYWVVGFLPLYIWYHIRYGYINNPLEVEARFAEKDSAAQAVRACEEKRR